MTRKVYLKNCPRCNHELIVDDVDYNFKGNQDEYSICPKCFIFLFTKVRYNNICKTTIDEMDQDTKEMYREEFEGVK